MPVMNDSSGSVFWLGPICQPALGLTPEQQARLDTRYAGDLAPIPDGAAKPSGIAVAIRSLWQCAPRIVGVCVFSTNCEKALRKSRRQAAVHDQHWHVVAADDGIARMRYVAGHAQSALRIEAQPDTL